MTLALPSRTSPDGSAHVLARPNGSGQTRVVVDGKKLTLARLILYGELEFGSSVPIYLNSNTFGGIPKWQSDPNVSKFVGMNYHGEVMRAICPLLGTWVIQ